MYEILTDRVIVEVYGEDSMNFLHNLTTNDIKKHDYCYTFALTNQGRYLFDFFILKLSPTSFYIDISASQVDLFNTHLMMYKLRAKVAMQDLSDVYQLVYSKQKLEFNTIKSVKDPRYNKLGFRSIVTKNSLLDKGMKGLYLNDKYNFAIVDGVEDLIYNKSIPIEYGCEELNALSYTKGCYIGQEVISRTKYQGVVRKKIFKLSFSSTNTNISVSKNDDIFAYKEKIGVICSVYNNNAIALVREEEYLSLHEECLITVNDALVILSIPPWRL